MEEGVFLELIKYYAEYIRSNNVVTNLKFDVPFFAPRDEMGRLRNDIESGKLYKDIGDKLSMIPSMNLDGSNLSINDYTSKEGLSIRKFSINTSFGPSSSDADYQDAMKVFEVVREHLQTQYSADFNPNHAQGQNRITSTYGINKNGTTVFDLVSRRTSASVNGAIAGQMVEWMGPFVLTNPNDISARWNASHAFGGFFQPGQPEQAYNPTYEHRGEEKWFGFSMNNNQQQVAHKFAPADVSAERLFAYTLLQQVPYIVDNPEEVFDVRRLDDGSGRIAAARRPVEMQDFLTLTQEIPENNRNFYNLLREMTGSDGAYPIITERYYPILINQIEAHPKNTYSPEDRGPAWEWASRNGVSLSQDAYDKLPPLQQKALDAVKYYDFLLSSRFSDGTEREYISLANEVFKGYVKEEFFSTSNDVSERLMGGLLLNEILPSIRSGNEHYINFALGNYTFSNPSEEGMVRVHDLSGKDQGYFADGVSFTLQHLWTEFLIKTYGEGGERLAKSLGSVLAIDNYKDVTPKSLEITLTQNADIPKDQMGFLSNEISKLDSSGATTSDKVAIFTLSRFDPKSLALVSNHPGENLNGLKGVPVYSNNQAGETNLRENRLNGEFAWTYVETSGEKENKTTTIKEAVPLSLSKPDPIGLKHSLIYDPYSSFQLNASEVALRNMRASSDGDLTTLDWFRNSSDYFAAAVGLLDDGGKIIISNLSEGNPGSTFIHPLLLDREFHKALGIELVNKGLYESGANSGQELFIFKKVGESTIRTPQELNAFLGLSADGIEIQPNSRAEDWRYVSMNKMSQNRTQEYVDFGDKRKKGFAQGIASVEALVEVLYKNYKPKQKAARFVLKRATEAINALPDLYADGVPSPEEYTKALREAVGLPMDRDSQTPVSEEATDFIKKNTNLKPRGRLGWVTNPSRESLRELSPLISEIVPQTAGNRETTEEVNFIRENVPPDIQRESVDFASRMTQQISASHPQRAQIVANIASLRRTDAYSEADIRSVMFIVNEIAAGNITNENINHAYDLAQTLGGDESKIKLLRHLDPGFGDLHEGFRVFERAFDAVNSSLELAPNARREPIIRVPNDLNVGNNIQPVENPQDLRFQRAAKKVEGISSKLSHGYKALLITKGIIYSNNGDEDMANLYFDMTKHLLAFDAAMLTGSTLIQNSFSRAASRKIMPYSQASVGLFMGYKIAGMYGTLSRLYGESYDAHYASLAEMAGDSEYGVAGTMTRVDVAYLSKMNSQRVSYEQRMYNEYAIATVEAPITFVGDRYAGLGFVASEAWRNIGNGIAYLTTGEIGAESLVHLAVNEMSMDGRKSLYPQIQDPKDFTDNPNKRLTRQIGLSSYNPSDLYLYFVIGGDEAAKLMDISNTKSAGIYVKEAGGGTHPLEKMELNDSWKTAYPQWFAKSPGVAEPAQHDFRWSHAKANLGAYENYILGYKRVYESVEGLLASKEQIQPIILKEYGNYTPNHGEFSGGDHLNLRLNGFRQMENPYTPNFYTAPDAENGIRVPEFGNKEWALSQALDACCKYLNNNFEDIVRQDPLFMQQITEYYIEGTGKDKHIVRYIDDEISPNSLSVDQAVRMLTWLEDNGYRLDDGKGGIYNLPNRFDFLDQIKFYMEDVYLPNTNRIINEENKTSLYQNLVSEYLLNDILREAALAKTLKMSFDFSDSYISPVSSIQQEELARYSNAEKFVARNLQEFIALHGVVFETLINDREYRDMSVGELSKGIELQDNMKNSYDKLYSILGPLERGTLVVTTKERGQEEVLFEPKLVAGQVIIYAKPSEIFGTIEGDEEKDYFVIDIKPSHDLEVKFTASEASEELQNILEAKKFVMNIDKDMVVPVDEFGTEKDREQIKEHLARELNFSAPYYAPTWESKNEPEQILENNELAIARREYEGSSETIRYQVSQVNKDEDNLREEIGKIKKDKVWSELYSEYISSAPNKTSEGNGKKISFDELLKYVTSTPSQADDLEVYNTYNEMFRSAAKKFNGSNSEKSPKDEDGEQKPLNKNSRIKQK